MQIIEDPQPRIIQQHCKVHQWILSTGPCLVACKGEFGGYSRMGTSSNISCTTIATVDGRRCIISTNSFTSLIQTVNQKLNQNMSQAWTITTVCHLHHLLLKPHIFQEQAVYIVSMSADTAPPFGNGCCEN
jgi:hypothetical protein